MRIFRLLPHRPGAHWALSLNRGEVVVRARTSGEARFVAAHTEAAFARAAGNLGFDPAASAFRNPLLYHVVRDGTGRYDEEGAVQVVCNSFEHRARAKYEK